MITDSQPLVQVSYPCLRFASSMVCLKLEAARTHLAKHPPANSPAHCVAPWPSLATLSLSDALLVYFQLANNRQLLTFSY